MLHLFLRIPTEVGPAAVLIVLGVIGIAAAIVLFIGIALLAALRARNAEQRKLRYQIFRDLLDLFRVIVCKLLDLFRHGEHE